MLKFLIRRTLLIIPSLLGACTLVFFLAEAIPGDPVDRLLGERASFEEKEELRNHLGLNKPLLTRYLEFLKKTSSGDLGESLISRESVFKQILEYIGPTVELALGGIFLSILLGIPLGVLAAIKPEGLLDRATLIFGSIGIAIPSFVSAPILIWLFAITFRLFPVGERGGLEHLFLPSLSLAIPLGAYLMRMTKTSMTEVIYSDYIRTARSKAIPEKIIYFKHALANAASPIITIVGLQLGALLTGIVITETIFDWPGLGSLLFSALQQRDYPMIQGCVIFMALIYILINTLTDIMYTLVNPKVKVF